MPPAVELYSLLVINISFFLSFFSTSFSWEHDSSSLLHEKGVIASLSIREKGKGRGGKGEGNDWVRSLHEIYEEEC